MLDVACVGILVADIITKTVDRTPEKGRLSLVDSISLYTGGCAANSAIDLAKLGARAAVAGMVGNDGFGSFMRAELARHGVDVRALAVKDGTDTSASVVLSDSGGERTFLHCLGANAVFTEEDVDYTVIQDAKIVFVAGSMLMPAFDGVSCAAFLKKAKRLGKTTALDTAWDDTGRWMKVLAPCMEHLDYFIPSIEEARQLSGEAEPEKIAEAFFDRGVKSVVIKLGKQGCYMQESPVSRGKYLSTYARYGAVDTTGAGDSFCAGFLYGLSNGMTMEESCRLANAVGTHCVMHMGASTGIRSYEETARFMEENAL